MRVKKIPLEKYTDNVRMIVETPEDERYRSMILGMPDEDLETAIAVMESHDICKGKTGICRAELKNRNNDEDIKNLGWINHEWPMWFAAEWTKITRKLRRAAGYEC